MNNVVIPMPACNLTTIPFHHSFTSPPSASSSPTCQHSTCIEHPSQQFLRHTPHIKNSKRKTSLTSPPSPFPSPSRTQAPPPRPPSSSPPPSPAPASARTAP